MIYRVMVMVGFIALGALSAFALIAMIEGANMALQYFPDFIQRIFR